jgi:DNA-directed RNA polymerase specialized sigma24 family protein
MAVEALRQGGPAELSAFYRDHAAVVLAWAIRLGDPTINPDRIAHRTFRRALKRLRHFDGTVELDIWLFWNLQVELRRARRWGALRRWLRLEATPGQVRKNGREGLLLRRRLRVQTALNQLPLKLREVVVLVELEDRSPARAAALLKLKPDVVLARLAEARPLLGPTLADAGVLSADNGDQRGRVLEMPSRADWDKR